MAVELSKGDDIALRRAWFPVLHRRRDPLGHDEEVRGRRSPSFSKFCNQRSVMVEGRHSSATISLTDISLGGGRQLYKSLHSTMCCTAGAQGGVGRTRATAMAECGRDDR